MGTINKEELTALAQGDPSEEAEEFLSVLEEGAGKSEVQAAAQAFVNHLLGDGTIEKEDVDGLLNYSGPQVADDDGDEDEDALLGGGQGRDIDPDNITNPDLD